MKVLGGSFGPDGTANIHKKSKIAIRSARSADYLLTELQSINSSQKRNRKFSSLSFLLGAIILGFIGLFLLGLLGLVIGVALAIAGSYYSTTSNTAEIEFSDGKTLSVTGTPGEIRKLYKSAPK